MDKIISRNGFWTQLIKGGIFALLLSVISVLVLAMISRFFSVSTDVLPIINQVLKIVAVVIAVFLTVKDGSFLFKGMLIGLLYSVLSLLLFLTLGGHFNLVQFTVDALTSVAVGGICGLLVSKRAKRN